MNNLGRSTAEGFISGAPSVEDLLSRAGILREGFDGLDNTEAGKHLHDGVENSATELRRSYARLFSGHGSKHDADAVLEDMLNQSMRRSMVVQTPGQTFESLAPYIAERHGQNGFALYMFKMMVDGRDLPPPKAAKKSRKKRK